MTHKKIGTDILPNVNTFTRKRTFVLLTGIIFGTLMGALDNLVVSTAMPAIVSSLHQPNGLSFLIDAYVTSSAIGMAIFGKLSDHYNKKTILLSTLVIFILGSIFAGMSQNMSELILLRVVQGFGSGGFLPVGLAVIAAILPPKTRAKITGAVTSFIGIAIVAGPEMGAYIVSATTWRWVFYVNVPFGIASFLVILFVMIPLKTRLNGKFDILGSLLLSSWVSLLLFPLVEMAYSDWKITNPLTLSLFVIAISIFSLFLYVEIRIAKEPLIPFRMFKNRTVSAVSFLSFLRGGVLFSLSTFMAIFVTEVIVGSASTLRNLMYGFVVPMVAGSIFGGVLLSKLSYKTSSLIGTVCMTVGFIPLLSVSPITEHVFILHIFPALAWLGLIPIGFGVGFTMVTTTLSAQYSVDTRDIGASTSIVQFMGNIGGSLILTSLSVLLYSVYRTNITSSLQGNVNSLGINEIAMSYAIREIYAILLLLSFATIVLSFFVKGRLPKSSYNS